MSFCTRIARLPALAALLLTVSALHAEPARIVKRFIGCPIYRDTDAGRKSGCWLSEDPAEGVRYDISDGRIKPILGRQVFVEGVVSSDAANVCGGIVLQPVSVSVLDAPCKEFLIPAEGHPGRRFELPAEVMQPTSVPRVLPPPPYGPREFIILFELNSDFLAYQYAELIVEKAVLYTRASKARRVTITGYAATRGAEVSGQLVRESPAIAEARARMLAEAFTRLGVARELLQLKWQAEPATAPSAPDGLTEAAKRRAVIAIEP